MQKRIKSMPINIERPRSALLRGVRITEFKGHIINPDPILLQETDFLLEEFLSPTKLKALTGVNDLNNVKHLEMIVDTSETSLGNFGIYLPNLKQLKLNGSFVPRIRDLGTSLTHLKVLWLSRSGLVELDGIPTLTNLEEVYLAYNEITDISPCSMLDNLKCLDLEGNLLDDLKQVEFLNLCSKLENLTLYGNPICVKPTPDVADNDSYSYRHEIIKILPHLKTLDDELTLNTKPLSPLKPIASNPFFSNKTAQQKSSTINYECPFDDDWQLINQFIAEGIGPSEDKLAINESLRPGTSSSRGSRPNTSVRPLSAMRPLSSYRIRTSAVNQERPSSRLTSASNNNSNKSSRVNTSEKSDSPEQISDILIDSSCLTVGPTLQGNPLKALLARKRPNSSNFINETKCEQDKTSTKVNLDEAIKKLEIDESNLKNKELKSELLNWKKDHAKKLEERKHYFEPQVLRIEDNYDETDARILSDNDETTNYNYYDEYHEIRNITNDDTSNELNNLISPRLQSASRSKPNELIVSSDEPLLVKEKRSKSRQRSKSRSGQIKRSIDDDLLVPINRSINREDSDLSSRIETGDTGYASFSSISVSSLSSITDRLTQNSHQPTIVSSHLGSSLVKTPLLVQPPHSQTSLTKGSSLNTLKQLKTNLMPLSSSYLQKK